ncbi:hypothetical protein JTB14_029460 [Gonioctena quinquepunctata]|nr:hypothetical protein JTB14_029460 [Gonioctena quinquepunctata]
MLEVEKSIKSIHEEILKNRVEIKNCIEASETRLLLKFEQLKNTVSKLEKENYTLREEVENLKRIQNKKNIIIFGLKKKREEITAENLCRDLNEILGVELREGDVGDIYPLGKSINCPIKIEFNSNLKKKEVLTNCNKLKGRNISIANDLTHTQRSENKILRKHLFLAKQEGNYRDCYIRGDRLFVDGISYGVEDLEKEDYPETKHNSAPSTPIVEPLEKVSTDLRRGPSTPKTSVAKKTVPSIYIPVPEKPRTRSINKNQ